MSQFVPQPPQDGEKNGKPWSQFPWGLRLGTCLSFGQQGSVVSVHADVASDRRARLWLKGQWDREAGFRPCVPS